MIPSVQEIDNEMYKLASLRKIATGEDKGPGFFSRMNSRLETAGRDIGRSLQGHGARFGNTGALLNDATHGGVNLIHQSAAAAAHSMVSRGDPSHVFHGSVMLAALDHTPGHNLSMTEKLGHAYGKAMFAIGTWVRDHPRTALAGMLVGGAGAVGGAGYGGYKAYEHYKQSSEAAPTVPSEAVEKEIHGWLHSVNKHLTDAGTHIGTFATEYPRTALGLTAGAGALAVGGAGYGGYKAYQHFKQSSFGDERSEALVARALELRGQG